jgi:CheY-like chemotaxis protein
MPGWGPRKASVSLVSIVPSLLGRVPVGLSGLQILVIEDAPDVLDVLTMLLRIEGADVSGAGSGHEALKVFRSRHFDVVVSDLGLPDISGDVLIRTIIAAARRPSKLSSSLVKANASGPARWKRARRSSSQSRANGKAWSRTSMLSAWHRPPEVSAKQCSSDGPNRLLDQGPVLRNPLIRFT